VIRVSDPFGTAAAEEWVDEWTASIAARASQARQLSDKVSRMSATATSADGAIEVTVGSQGSITDLRLQEEVRRWPVEQIATEILATIKDAQRAMSGRIATAVEETIGADTESGRAILAGLKDRTAAPGGGDRRGR
jgi:DNA-binding protein YbaB